MGDTPLVSREHTVTIASFPGPARSSLAVQNSLRGPGLVHHVMSAIVVFLRHQITMFAVLPIRLYTSTRKFQVETSQTRTIDYRIAGKFGEEFNLANWRGILKNAKLKIANFEIYVCLCEYL